MSNEMSPELRRALESIADLRGQTFEEVCANIGVGGKKEVVVEWTAESVRYLPERTYFENLSWFIYWTRETIRIEMIRAAEKANEEWDLEILFGFRYGSLKMRLPDLDKSLYIIT